MALYEFFTQGREAVLWQVIWTSFFAGATLHLAIGTSSIEFERYIVPSLGVVALAYCGVLALCHQLYGCGLLAATALPSLACAGFGSGVVVSLAVYRLWLHRCRRFPGPRLAGLSRFYLAYMNANLKDSQYYQKLEDLHRRYGDYVRIGQ